jgi:hypothetical protein
MVTVWSLLGFIKETHNPQQPVAIVEDGTGGS